MQKKTIWPALGNIILLIWALACLVIFMYFPGAISQIQDATLYEFPLLPEKLARISAVKYFLDILVSTLGMAFYGSSCLSLGMAFAGLFHLDEIIINDTDPVKGVLVSTYFLLGHALYSIVFLALAVFYTLSPTLSFTILGIGLLSGLTKFKKPSIQIPYIQSNYEKVVIVLTITLAALSLLQSSARLSYDATSMYFSIAKLTALENHIGYYMANSFPISAFHSVIQYSAVMQVFGDQSARMISWLFGVMNIALALSLAKLVGASTSARRILPALILTSTAFLDQMGDGKVDLISTSYSLAAVYWVVLANTRGQRQNYLQLLLSGCFIGFACILRPHNFFLLGLFVITIIMQHIKADRTFFLQSVRQIGWLALGAVGFALYHFLINKMVLGSPFAFWNSITNIHPNEGPWDFKPERLWTFRFLYPFVVTFKNSGASLGNITPLVLVFMPILAVKEVRDGIRIQKEALQLFISAGIVLFSWVFVMFTVVEVRYVLFLWIILFIFVSEIATRALETKNVIIKNLAICSIVLLMSFILVRSSYISVSTYSPLDTQKNPNCFDNDLCRLFTTINETAGEGDRVLTLSAFRYYLRTDLFTCSTRHDEFNYFRTLSIQDTNKFWLEVYRKGYKFIAFEEGYTTDSAQLKIIPSPDNTPNWIKLVPIFGESGDRQVAYRIDVTDPPISVETMCKRNNISGIWEVQPATP